MKRRLVLTLTFAAAAAAALQGCATATGAPFATLEAVPAGQANLYLYRQPALYASGQPFKVRAADGKLVGELFNGSYMLLSLAPGKHSFTVDEGGFAGPKKFEVNAKAGGNYFVEYDASKGLLLGWGLLSDSAARSEAQALADLKGLKRAN